MGWAVAPAARSGRVTERAAPVAPARGSASVPRGPWSVMRSVAAIVGWKIGVRAENFRQLSYLSIRVFKEVPEVLQVVLGQISLETSGRSSRNRRVDASTRPSRLSRRVAGRANRSRSTAGGSGNDSPAKQPVMRRL
jgi:hypothetical protein